MPIYSYACNKCNDKFELFFSYAKYDSQPQCPKCMSSIHTSRLYVEDALTISASVKKADSELKTIGDLANRNRDRLSDDEKVALHNKHNSYKEQEQQKELPKGMSRIPKSKKTQWTDAPRTKVKRKVNEKKRNS
jgi:putative FmdB family regulatory protein